MNTTAANLTRLLLSLALCALPLAACGPPPEPAVTFSVGGAPDELAFWEELIEEFQRESGLRVELIRQPTGTDQRRQGLVIPLQSGQSDPDVFLMDVIWIPQFAASGWLAGLSGLSAVDPGDFFDRVVDLAGTYRGRLVALPVYVDGGLLYYRKDLLEKYGYARPPETWPELREYSLRIQEGERRENPRFYGFVWQGAQYEGLVCNFLEYAGSAGGGIFLKDGRIAVDLPANRRALEFMRSLVAGDPVSPPNTYTEMKEEEVRAFFGGGRAAFERNWPYAWALHQEEGSPVRGRVGIAPLPAFPGGESASTLGGWHVGISAFTDLPKESRRLVEYILSFPVQKRLALRLGWNPGRTDVYRDPEVLAAAPHLAELREVFQNTLPRPALPYYTLFSEILQRYLNRALSGRIEPAAALAAAEREAGKIVDRYGGGEAD